MKDLSLYLMALLYIGAGILHFIRPNVFMSIIPPWLPFPKFLVLASGACELVFGVLLLPTATRPITAWLIIALLIAVFPANVQMALQFTEQHRVGWWLTWLRLPLQGLLIWWAYTFTK